MTLKQLLDITRDHHAELETGAITVNLCADESDYWHLSDYAVSSRAGMMLVMVPRMNPVASHAQNGWQFHCKRP